MSVALLKSINHNHTDFEALAKLDKLRHPLVHLTLNESLSFLCEPLSLIRNKVSESWQRIGRWLRQT
jgi:hypothetical protein